MCGRFTLTKSSYEIADLFEIAEKPEDMEPNYNIVPSGNILTMIKDNIFSLELFRWGLVPHWAKEINTKYSMINARAETLMEKSSYRKLFMTRHCVIIADGFYEWTKSGSGKIPNYIKLKTGEIFGFAGLWDLWEPGGENQPVKSCTIITTEANNLLKQIHHRMPVILTGENIKNWLKIETGNKENFLSLLRAYPEEEIEFFPVSKYVNSPKNNSPDCIKPLKIIEERDLFS